MMTIDWLRNHDYHRRSSSRSIEDPLLGNAMSRDMCHVLIKLDPVAEGMMASNPLTFRYEKGDYMDRDAWTPLFLDRLAKYFVCCLQLRRWITWRLIYSRFIRLLESFDEQEKKHIFWQIYPSDKNKNLLEIIQKILYPRLLYIVYCILDYIVYWV